MSKRTPRTLARLLVVSLASLILFSIALPAHAVTGDEKAVAWRVNNEHYKRSLRALSVWESLSNTARAHSCTMARQQKLYHNPYLSRQVPRGWSVVGENVAMGYDLYQVHLAWMKSWSHRDNILERRYRAVGSGVCRDSSGTYWVTTIFYG